jgi:hypothetical protein
MDKSKVYDGYYFKWLFDEKGVYMSGRKLPDPNKGPYKFVNCEMHPQLWEALNQLYTDSIYINTYHG